MFLGCVTTGLLCHAIAAQWSRLYYVRSVHEVSTTQSLAVDRMEKTIGLYMQCATMKRTTLSDIVLRRLVLLLLEQVVRKMIITLSSKEDE